MLHFHDSRHNRGDRRHYRAGVVLLFQKPREALAAKVVAELMDMEGNLTPPTEQELRAHLTHTAMSPADCQRFAEVLAAAATDSEDPTNTRQGLRKRLVAEMLNARADLNHGVIKKRIKDALGVEGTPEQQLAAEVAAAIVAKESGEHVWGPLQEAHFLSRETAERFQHFLAPCNPEDCKRFAETLLKPEFTGVESFSQEMKKDALNAILADGVRGDLNGDGTFENTIMDALQWLFTPEEQLAKKVAAEIHNSQSLSVDTVQELTKFLASKEDCRRFAATIMEPRITGISPLSKSDFLLSHKKKILKAIVNARDEGASVEFQNLIRGALEMKME